MQISQLDVKTKFLIRGHCDCGGDITSLSFFANRVLQSNYFSLFPKRAAAGAKRGPGDSVASSADVDVAPWPSLDRGSGGGTRGWCATPAGRTAPRAREMARRSCVPGQLRCRGDWMAVAKVSLGVSLVMAAAIMAATGRLWCMYVAVLALIPT